MSNALYHCKKAELHLPDGKAIPAKVSIGPIVGLIVAAAEKTAYQLVTPIEISFLDPIMGVVTCMCSLTAPLVDEDRTEYSYRCEILQQLSQDQRREDIKVPLAATVTIKLEGGTGAEAQATLRNISAGGVYLITSLGAAVGSRLSFMFHGAGGSLPLTAQVLRVEQVTDRLGRPLFGYGCQFVHLASRYEAQLRSYVFSEERRLHKIET